MASYDQGLHRFTDPIFIPPSVVKRDRTHWCAALHPSGWICTAAPGHEGLHAGWRTDQTLAAIWDENHNLESPTIGTISAWEEKHPGCFLPLPTEKELKTARKALTVMAKELARDGT